MSTFKNKPPTDAGDLVHVPASVRLMKMIGLDDFSMPVQTIINPEPTVVLLINRYYDYNHAEVFYMGEKWTVRRENIYKI
jgi:hypothetical protein